MHQHSVNAPLVPGGAVARFIEFRPAGRVLRHADRYAQEIFTPSEHMVRVRIGPCGLIV